MVIVYLQGGLGNQMFQYAFAKRIAIERSQTLYLDLSFYKEQFNPLVDKREYTLRKFDINLRVLPVCFSYFFNPGHNASYFRKTISKGLRKISSTAIINEKLYDTVQDIIHFPVKNLLLKGYWQDEKYFSPISLRLRKQFYCVEKFKKLEIQFRNKLKTEDSVGIHIRRGDYLKNPVHGVLPIEYYKDAMDYLKTKISHPIFYCFTDDPEWVKNNFPLAANFILCSSVYSKSDFEDLQLMATCCHQIIANSTFSWWAAWLNENPNKIVIAPKIWFAANESSTSIECKVPASWLTF